MESNSILFEHDAIHESWLKKSITALIYILLYQFIYINYLCVKWGYFGYNLFNNTIPYFILAISISFIPILFYRGLLRVSSYFAILIYVLAYVPIITSLTFNTLGHFQSIFTSQLAIMIGMILLFSTDKLKLSNLLKLSIRKKLPFFIIHIIVIVLTLYLLIIFKGKIRLVNFDSIYDLRSSNDILSNNGLNGYFIMWLSYCFYPLYFTLGIVNKKKLYTLAGITGCIFIYSITGAKASLLEPLIIFSIYKLINMRRIFSFFQLIIISILVLSILILTGGSILTMVGTIFFMRTLSMPGLLTSQYIEFFANHKYTYYSHINIVNSIFGIYPYGQEPLGKVIGYYFFNNDINSNAIFWATDGVAAMGQLGIILISLIIMLFLVFLNNTFKYNGKAFTLVIFTPAILIMLNSSFFSTLLSGGLLFLIIILNIFKIPQEEEKFMKAIEAKL